jgi:hypothetical protein
VVSVSENADPNNAYAQVENFVSKTYSYVDPLHLPKQNGSHVRESIDQLCVWVEPPCKDPGQTGLFSRVSGTAYFAPPNFITTARDATVIGYRTVLADQYFFTDQSFGRNTDWFVDKIGSSEPFPNEDTRLRRQDGSNSFKLDICGRHSRKISGTAVNLTSAEPSNYGSFLFRVLPKISAMKANDLLDIPVLVYAYHSSFINLLTLAGIDSNNIIRHDTNLITHIDHLISPSLRNPDAFLDEESKFLFSKMIEKFGSSKIAGRKLYISRLDHAKQGYSPRMMLNEEELIQRLISIGFDIFEPEKYSSIDQIKAFSSAEMIVGPSGSAMFNTVFCRPGTKIIDIESERDWIYTHTGLFSSTQLRYGIFVGEVNSDDPRPVHRSWKINIDALVDRIALFDQA